MNRYASLTLALGAVTVAAAGCTSQSTPVPNPFSTADRVPPPAMRSVEGVAPAYYPGAAAPAYPAPPAVGAAPAYGNAPAYGAAPAYNAAPPVTAPAYGAPPATSSYAPSAPGPAPGTATPYYGASTSRSAVTPGDTISVPTDAGSLRYATPEESYLARQESQPVPRAGATQLAQAPDRPTATANGWIAGSAPVRSSAIASSPRVRLPGEGWSSEPISLAAIDRTQGVPIAPLEPAPTGARPGEPAPLRVATPSGGTGWR
ncbi:hypothetical protein Pla108_21820 [Botrimarina colliarenosi]|uniref:Uncharacterized protein n=1 Tax=Botrimarina colliarenosi TaxID=2528001 RepID=A0A5C6AF33_9BACT|nr:hypothetical protein [Botrimarina colliarenosi]TWT98027.1 hypothetical protein Pla108_21820 [Botrimarina colliarenosi]